MRTFSTPLLFNSHRWWKNKNRKRSKFSYRSRPQQPPATSHPLRIYSPRKCRNPHLSTNRQFTPLSLTTLRGTRHHLTKSLWRRWRLRCKTHWATNHLQHPSIRTALSAQSSKTIPTSTKYLSVSRSTRQREKTGTRDKTTTKSWTLFKKIYNRRSDQVSQFSYSYEFIVTKRTKNQWKNRMVSLSRFVAANPNFQIAYWVCNGNVNLNSKSTNKPGIHINNCNQQNIIFQWFNLLNT